jgi:3-deoxy-D-manno-octulosonate 8-phosphate phosphatase (KDO 8-P phosphatase)
MDTKSRKIQQKAKKIKLIAMDIDGVLTGGEIIVLDSQEEVKIWNVKDRFAFHLVQRGKINIKFAWITGRHSQQVLDRAREIDIEVLYQNCMKKKEALQEIARRFGLSAAEIAFIGDDLVDVSPLRYAGLAVCPSDALPEVIKEVDYVTSVPGGKGVLREVVDLVLKSQGLWKRATEGYL